MNPPCVFPKLFFPLLALVSSTFSEGTVVKKTIQHGGLEREYILYLPDNYDGKQQLPLVLAFHGGGGTAKQAMDHYKWHPLADQHGFMVCYPEGINKHWNDGRVSKVFREENTNVDDVGFIKTLLNQLYTDYKIDRKRVFSSGASNGGMFSHRLGIDLSEHFTAIAPVISCVPEAIVNKFEPGKPVSVLMINGTDDPFVPYNGGDVQVSFLPRWAKLRKPKSRGKVVSTDTSIQLWLKYNAISTEPTLTNLPDTNKDDGVTAKQKTWTDPKRNITVSLITVEGGGHTWPNGKQYLPSGIIGKTCRDFGAELIWDFFSKHGRKTVK
ncbi:MAG: hypothetical protein K9M45_06335 [Kiritimatiellales bacterium]|nr:hypothetical protein [Kiritimatiellales bacterium]